MSEFALSYVEWLRAFFLWNLKQHTPKTAPERKSWKLCGQEFLSPDIGAVEGACGT